MALINTIIPPASFEVIRDQVGVVLTGELANQLVLTGDYDLAAVVWKERFIQFDKSEYPAINITLAQGSYDGQTAIQMDGTYTIFIDCYAAAKSNSSDGGDKLAMLKLQKLLRVCRAIIENPKYICLGLTPPFVMNRHISALNIQDPKGPDATSAVMGRLTLLVKVPENTELLVPQPIEGVNTNITLNETDEGYFWQDDFSY